MNNFYTNIFFPAFVIGTFVAVVLFIEGLYLLWNSYRGPEAKKIDQRLRIISASTDVSPQTSVLKNRMLSEVSALNRLFLSIPRIHNLDRFLLQSGLNWTVSTLIFLSAMLWGIGYLAAVYAGQFPSLINSLIACGVACLPALFVQWKRNRRFKTIGQQLPDTLDLIGRAMSAGHSFSSSLKMVGEEMPDPIAAEFAIVHDEINFGVTLQQSLFNLGQRLPMTDLRYFIIAVLIQREAGGNLTEVLSNLSHLIRERLKLQAKVRVLTAEGRISAWTLGILPFVLAALLNFGNPEFIRVLWTDPVGIKMTEATLFVMAVGVLWLWRLTKFRV